MLTTRVIARMDIKGPNLVKGIHLEGLRVLGKPRSFAFHYCREGIDELLYMDVVASLYDRNSILPIIEETAKNTFIPLTVGGGLRSIDDIRNVLRSGADKVSLNTAAIRNPSLLREASRIFGSSTIVVCIEAIRQPDGSYHAFTDNGREETGRDVYDWAREAEDLGAGEIIITSVDQEGTGKGFDVELTSRLAEMLSVPVVAHGGAGKPDDVAEVIAKGKADAVCIASMLHYNSIKYFKSHQEEYDSEGNIEFLKQGGNFMVVQDCSVKDLKAHLRSCGIDCRVLPEGEADE